MPRVPWKSLCVPQPDREYVALISYLPLKHYRAIPKFLRLVFEAKRQLASCKGLIGYSLDAQPFARRFWTLSAWEDQQALMDSVRQAPHSRIMKDLAPHMDKTQFAQWKVSSAELPPDWRQQRIACLRDSHAKPAIKEQSLAIRTAATTIRTRPWRAFSPQSIRGTRSSPDS